MRELHETAKQQLIDDKFVGLVQRCFNSSLVTHFLIRIYQSLFYEGFCLWYNSPCFKIQKKLFPKGYGAEKP